MIKSCLRGLFVIALVAGSPASADKLPAVFAALPPQGYKVDPPRSSKQGMMAVVSFVARKHFNGRHSVQDGEYRFELTMTQLSKELVAMQAPGYRAQLESEIPRKIPKANPTGFTIRDPAVVKKSSWGNAITQKITHKYVGAGSGPDEIEYVCQYYGFMAAGDTIKQFELRVSGVGSREEADAWAAQAVTAIGKASMNDI